MSRTKHVKRFREVGYQTKKKNRERPQPQNLRICSPEHPRGIVIGSHDQLPREET